MLGYSIAVTRASAEPVPPSEDTVKNKEKAVSATDKIAPRPGRRSTVVTAADTRATYLLEGAERSSILTRGSCTRKS